MYLHPPSRQVQPCAPIVFPPYAWRCDWQRNSDNYHEVILHCGVKMNVMCVVIQASADVRPRVREPVVRVRVRKTAKRPVVRETPNEQQLHGVSPFHRPLAAVELDAREWDCFFVVLVCVFTVKTPISQRKFSLSAQSVVLIMLFVNSLFYSLVCFFEHQLTGRCAAGA